MISLFRPSRPIPGSNEVLLGTAENSRHRLSADVNIMCMRFVIVIKGKKVADFIIFVHAMYPSAQTAPFLESNVR